MRRAIAGLFVVLILCTAGWLFAQVLRRPQALSTGDTIPTLSYHAPSRPAAALRADGAAPTLVMLFHSKCGHCHFQLDQMNAAVDRFADARVFLFTTEDSLPTREVQERWGRLYGASNVTWGTVAADDFQKDFGVLATPAIFTFDPQGKLLRKIQGEAKVDFLVEALRG